jgi:integrase
MADQDYGLETLNDPQTGPRILNEYALYLAGRVQDQTLAASTAERYFAYVSACLSFGVRQGVLDRNPALSDTATESLPRQQRSDRTDQQFWSQAQRETIVSFVDEEADSFTADSPDRWLTIRNTTLVCVLAYSGVRGAEILSHPKDDRDGRNGLRWKNVALLKSYWLDTICCETAGKWGCVVIGSSVAGYGNSRRKPRALARG